jgi:hypothetical protein
MYRKSFTRARGASAGVEGSAMVVVSLFATKLWDKIGETNSATVSSVALIVATIT